MKRPNIQMGIQVWRGIQEHKNPIHWQKHITKPQSKKEAYSKNTKGRKHTIESWPRKEANHGNGHITIGNSCMLKPIR